MSHRSNAEKTGDTTPNVSRRRLCLTASAAAIGSFAFAQSPATKVQCSRIQLFDHLDGDRGKTTLNSANSPGTVSTSIEAPCCLTTMS